MNDERVYCGMRKERFTIATKGNLMDGEGHKATAHKNPNLNDER